MVKINSNLTLSSCQSMLIELDEYLAGTPRVLFDFGTMSTLDNNVLAEIDKLIKAIEMNSVTVKAASRNRVFVDSIILDSNVSTLAGVLRYF